MSRAQTRPANPAPTTHSAVHAPKPAPDSQHPSSSSCQKPIAKSQQPLRPYSFLRPFPTLPEQWQSPQAQAKLLDEYLKHDGHFATFAAQRNLSVDQLYDWLNSEAIMAQRKRLSDMAQERADLLARLARPAAIEALLNLLTKGCMSDNQLRLAAGALLRAAASADRREEKGAREAASPSAVPPVSGSSAGRCQTPPAFPSHDDSADRGHSSGAIQLPQPVKRAAVYCPGRQPGVHALPAAGAREPGEGAVPSLAARPTNPSRILARIGPAASPVPPRKRRRR